MKLIKLKLRASYERVKELKFYEKTLRNFIYKKD